MLTLRRFADSIKQIPTGTAWVMTELSELAVRQRVALATEPHKIESLREHALIESAVSSNRIEGVEIEDKRIGTVLFGRPAFRDRDEEEVRGYRNALERIHTERCDFAISEAHILELHKIIRGEIWDAGRYKEKDADIIERYPDGRWRVRFSPVAARETPRVMADLVAAWQDAVRERWVHPLVALAAFNLDFLCIHPFRDGNGRVSRLLFLLQCYHCGIDVGRYVSLERIIEQNKERYYDTLETSSKGWNEGENDPWPYVNYVLFALREAYRELEAAWETP